jgi:hypothetical protein
MRKLIPLFILFFLQGFILNAQYTSQVAIDWEPAVDLSLDGEMIQALSFSEAFYDFNQHSLPVYKKRIQLPENVKEVHVSVQVQKKTPLTVKEQVLIKSSPESTLAWQIVYERKKPFLIFSYIPVEANNKVTKFSYSLDVEYQDFKLQEVKEIENSVLAEGDWYKLRVEYDGVYKIDKDLLNEMGVNVNSINPRNIQIYGNGGSMLPELNDTFRHNDLAENSIRVIGEEDESFDQGDLILFYAQGPHQWVWDEELGTPAFTHQLNIYSDYTYYYLHIGDSFGKRIADDEELSESNYAVNYFTDYRFHEWENRNMVSSGRQWFGEYFDLSDAFTFNFDFPDRLTSEPVRLKVRGVARSESQTSLKCVHNGEEILSVPMGTTVSSTIIVDDGEAYAEFISPDELIDLKLTYEKNGNSSAYAYLDYIELQSKRALNYTLGQFAISEPSTVAPGRLSEFQINTTNTDLLVWDVTDPVSVKSIPWNSSQGTSNFSVQTEVLKRFILHDGRNSTYQEPSFVGLVPNQNLHGQEQAELLIVTHPDFLEQANRLADFHREADGILVNVASTPQIYNEFSSGKQDLVAIRDYVRMFYDRALTEEDMPLNVILFGDASFDYKAIGEDNGMYDDHNFVPTFQSYSSFKLGPSYCTDDFLGMLDPTEGQSASLPYDQIDIGIGRLVIKDIQEAEEAVDKIIHYVTGDTFGDWRNNLCFVADDVDDPNWEFRLVQNMDKIATRLDTTHHNYNINKIYLDAYQQQSSSGGQRYPDARQAIVDNVTKGTLIIHYYGHGGEVGWAEERVLELSDINAWENYDNMPVFVTATCEFSRYDDPLRVSAGEQILLNSKGAGIALFTTTRTITESDARTLSTVFYEYAIPEDLGEHLTFGEIIRCMKNTLALAGQSAPGKRRFTLLGDPALRFPIPENKIQLDSIVNLQDLIATDTLQALSTVLVYGSVRNPMGEILEDFNGILQPTVYDKPFLLQTQNNDYEQLAPEIFSLQQSVLYSGNVSVENGLFEFEFVVPLDIAYAYGDGKMSFYADNGVIDATGAYVDFSIGGFNADAEEDFTGPEVYLYMNNNQFRSGGITDASPSLYAEIIDESGVNTTGNGIGHDIVAVLDGDSQSSIVLNHYYESDLDSYQSGKVSYPFLNLEDGMHQLEIKVWDVNNNSSEAFTEFLVVTGEEMILSNLMNYPNPFSEYTNFYFEHNHADQNLEVSLYIYTLQGVLVKTIEKAIYSSGFSEEEIYWDGRSEHGASLAKGMYIYRLNVKSEDSGLEEQMSNQMILIK